MASIPCPYCRAHPQSRNGFRDHLARRCQAVPAEVRQSIVVREADSYTEAEYQSLVVARFRDAGWLCFHGERGRGRDGDWLTNTSDPGLPDWLFIKPPTVLFVELKREKGSRPTAEQVRVIKTIQECTRVEGYFARPSDFAHLMTIAEA